MSDSKSKVRSPIWRYFEPLDTQRTKCLLCESSYRNCGNTTNLIDHLKRKHRVAYGEFNESIKSSNQSQSAKEEDSESNRPEDEISYALNNISKKEEQSEEILIDQASEQLQQEGEEEEMQFIETHEEEIEEGTFEETQDIQIVKIVPLPHARSEVWNYFGFVANDDGDILDRSKVVCKICASTFCYSGNTTNFYSHLKSMHSEINMRTIIAKTTRAIKRSYASINNDDGSETENGHMTNENSNTFGNNQNNFGYLDVEDPGVPERSQNEIVYIEDITDCIVDFLVTDCRPVCITQGRGFQRLIRLLAPGYQLPDRQKLSLSVRKRYDELRREASNLESLL